MKQRTPAPKGILIYGTGGVGLSITRMLVAKGWPIVAAVNRAGPKIGQDLGTLAGLAQPIGVKVRDADKVDLASFGADVAVVAVSDFLVDNMAHHHRLLEAGINVACLGGESSYPVAADKGMAAELDTLAKSHGVTFTGCGLWDAYRIWTLDVLTGPCTALRRIHHRSVTNVARFGPEVMSLAKIGSDPADVTGSRSESQAPIYRTLMHQAVESLGLRVESVEWSHEAITFDQPVEAPNLGIVKPGTCVGTRSIIDITTSEGTTARADIDLRLTLPDEGEWMSWSIDGDPSVEMKLNGIDTGHATSSSVVNRLPDIVAAPPGLTTVDQMAPMCAHGCTNQGANQ